jgi:molybdenum cofactor synthesis domain-containing protein
VALPHSLGLALAQDIICSDPLPTDDLSLRDGYALRSEDRRSELRSLGAATAGCAFAGVVGPGECVAIATGAMLPAGADAVAPAEDCATDGDRVSVRDWPAAGQFVHRRGSEAQEGDRLVTAGTVLGPEEIGRIADAGRFWVQVRRPQIGLVAIGDELVAVGEPIGPGQRRESNRWYLAAAVRSGGGDVLLARRMPDDVPALAEASAAWAGCHLVVTTGGAGCGPRDAARQLLVARAEVQFGAVEMRPGGGTLFALLRGVPVLALPGRAEAMKRAWQALGVWALDCLRGVA